MIGALGEACDTCTNHMMYVRQCTLAVYTCGLRCTLCTSTHWLHLLVGRIAPVVHIWVRVNLPLIYHNGMDADLG